MKRILTWISICSVLSILSNTAMYAEDPKSHPKKVIARAVSNVVPSGYIQVGSTDIYYQ